MVSTQVEFTQIQYVYRNIIETLKFAHAVLNSPAHNGKWGRNKMGANTVHTRLRLCFSLSASSLASFRRLASKSSLTHFCLSLKCSLLITVSDWLSSESDLWDLEGFDWSVATAAVFWLVDLDAESGTVVRGTGGFTKGLESFSNYNSKNSILTYVYHLLGYLCECYFRQCLLF